MPYRTLEVYLESLFVQENGTLAEEAAANLLTARLVYPRPGIPSRTSVKSLALEDGETRDMSDESFSRRILFKERVQGITEIGLDLTARLPDHRIPDLAAAVLASAAGAGLAVIGAGAGTPLLAAAALESRRAALRSGRSRREEEPATASVGAGATEIDVEDLMERSPVTRNVVLRIPRTVTLRRTRPEMEPDPNLSGPYHTHYRATREEVRLDAGDEAGWINLELRIS